MCSHPPPRTAASSTNKQVLTVTPWLFPPQVTPHTQSIPRCPPFTSRHSAATYRHGTVLSARFFHAFLLRSMHLHPHGCSWLARGGPISTWASCFPALPAGCLPGGHPHSPSLSLCSPTLPAETMGRTALPPRTTCCAAHLSERWLKQQPGLPSPE